MEVPTTSEISPPPPIVSVNEATDRLMTLASLFMNKSSEKDKDDSEYWTPSTGSGSMTCENSDTHGKELEHEPPVSFTSSSVQAPSVGNVPEATRAGTRTLPGLRRLSSDESDDSNDDDSVSGEHMTNSSGRSYFVKHEYCDHANTPLSDVSPLKSLSPNHRSNRGGVKMLFPEKLHQLLSLPESEVDPGIISWASHGRCFLVHHPREFTRELMPKYFSHNAITSFQRQLNLYGFKRITKSGSKDQGAYYHELFLRGRPALCRRMRRQKIKGTGYK